MLYVGWGNKDGNMDFDTYIYIFLIVPFHFMLCGSHLIFCYFLFQRYSLITLTS